MWSIAPMLRRSPKGWVLFRHRETRLDRTALRGRGQIDDRCPELAVGYRLVHEQEAAGLGFRQTIRRGVAGDQYRGYRLVVFRTNPFDDDEPAFAFAKAVVAQDQRRFRGAGGETQDRFIAALDRDDGVSPSRQKTQRRVAYRGLVVDHDHESFGRRHGGDRWRDLGDRRLMFRERDCHLEARAAAGLRVERQSAIEERGQPADDRKAKPEALR